MSKYFHYLNALQQIVSASTEPQTDGRAAFTALLINIHAEPAEALTRDEKWRLIVTNLYTCFGGQVLVSLGFMNLRKWQMLPPIYFDLLKDPPWSMESPAEAINQHFHQSHTSERRSMSDLLFDGMKCVRTTDIVWLKAYVDMFLNALDSGALPLLTQSTYHLNDATKAARNLVTACVTSLSPSVENVAWLQSLQDPATGRGRYCRSIQAYSLNWSGQSTLLREVGTAVSNMLQALQPPAVCQSAKGGCTMLNIPYERLPLMNIPRQHDSCPDDFL